MPIPLFQSAGQLSRKGWVVTTLVVYGAMCVGLLGYFAVFPDERTEKARAGVKSRVRAVAKGAEPVERCRKSGSLPSKELERGGEIGGPLYSRIPDSVPLAKIELALANRPETARAGARADTY